MKTLLGLSVVAGVAGLLAQGPVQAETYDFTFTGGSSDPGVLGSGTFTTNAANDTVVSGSGAFSWGSSISEAADLVSGEGVAQALSYDNVFPLDASGGLLFQGTTDANFLFNIFAPTGTALGVGTGTGWASAQDGGGYYSGSLGFSGVCNNCVAEGSLTIASVPELSTWAMLGLGFVGLGLAAAGRGRKSVFSIG